MINVFIIKVNDMSIQYKNNIVLQIKIFIFLNIKKKKCFYIN